MEVSYWRKWIKWVFRLVQLGSVASFIMFGCWKIRRKQRKMETFEFHNLSFGVQNYKMSYLLFMRSAMLWWWVVTGSTLNSSMKLLFCLPVTTKNNLPLKIWRESVLVIAFSLFIAYYLLFLFFIVLVARKIWLICCY